MDEPIRLTTDLAERASGKGYPLDLTTWLVMGALALAVVAAAVAMVLYQRYKVRRERQRFFHLADSFEMQPIREEQELDEISNSLHMLMLDLSSLLRELRLLRAYRQTIDGVELLVLHGVYGYERSNANLQTLDKMFVMFRALPKNLPGFMVLPNNSMFKVIYPNPVFAPETRFGKNNLVLGEERARIKETLNAGVRDRMTENKDMVIKAQDNTLVYYLHDVRVMPEKPVEFVNTCLDLTRDMIGRPRRR